MRKTTATAVLCLAALSGCGTDRWDRADAMAEAGRMDTPTETVTETVTETPAACRRVVNLSNRIDALQDDALETAYGWIDSVEDAARAGQWRDQQALDAVYADVDHIDAAVGDIMEQIGTLQGRRDVAADQCLGRW